MANMLLAPHDYHMHSQFSFDCPEAMEKMCQAAIDRSLPEIGFTEHFDLHPLAPWRDQLDLPAWNAEIERCQRTFAGRLTILKGLEFGEPHLFDAEFQKVSNAFAFDYILGSLHWVEKLNVFDPKYFDQGYLESFGKFFAELEVMTRQPRFDILSHFDVVARQGALRFPKYDPRDFEKTIRQVLRNCIDRGIALDINTAAMRQPAKLMTPNVQILTWYREMGGERVTFGADAHQAADVGAHFPQALDLLGRCGFDAVCRFRLRKESKIPLFFATV